MATDALHRRGFGGALLAAAFGAPAALRAQNVDIFTSLRASRLAPDRPPPPVSDYTPPSRLSAILDIYKRMTGAVTVEGKGPFAWVVDTGANQSVISAELAAQLGLAPGSPQPLNGVAGVQITPTVTATVAFGDRPAQAATLSVLPAKTMGGQGMLGLDLLSEARLTLDFQHQQVTIDRGPALPGVGNAYLMHAHRRDGPLTLVDANLAGIPVTAFIDSGAQDTIGNLALRELAVIRYPAVPWRPVPIVSVTGQTIDAEFGDLPGLRIGGATLPTWPVAFADLHVFRMWNMVDSPAILIGVDVLSRFESVSLDFRRNQVGFRVPTRFS